MSAAPRPGVVALALAALYVLWGSTYLAIRVGLEGFPPMLLSGLRYAVAGALLYGFLRLRGTPRPSGRQWAASAAVGVLLVTANVLVAAAQVTVSSGLASIVVASMPLWTAVGSGLLGQRPARLEWLGIAVGLSGVVLLQSGGELRASPAGAAMLVLSTWSWAVGSLLSRRVPLPEGLMASAAQMLCGGLVALAAALAHGDRLASFPGVRPLLALGWLVVAGSLVGFSAYAFLLRTVRPSLATSYAYVNPAVALVLGALTGEAVPPRALGALALVAAGVAIVASRPRDAQPA